MQMQALLIDEQTGGERLVNLEVQGDALAISELDRAGACSPSPVTLIQRKDNSLAVLSGNRRVAAFLELARRQ